MTSINDPGAILNLDRYNGRINILEPENPNAMFQMQERIAVKNKATEYRDAMTGIWEDNVLSQVFFSAGNITIVQNGIRAGVYKMSDGKFVVPDQNIDTLKIVMRGTFLQYAQFNDQSITKQVERLNQLVWDYAVPSVYNESVSYLKYCEDQSTLVVPIQRPVRTDRQYKQLELKEWF